MDGQVSVGRTTRWRSGRCECPIVQTHDLVERIPEPADAEIRDAPAANPCRCAGYERNLDAVRVAAGGKAAAR